MLLQLRNIHTNADERLQRENDEAGPHKENKLKRAGEEKKFLRGIPALFMGISGIPRWTNCHNLSPCSSGPPGHYYSGPTHDDPELGYGLRWGEDGLEPVHPNVTNDTLLPYFFSPSVASWLLDAARRLLS